MAYGFANDALTSIALATRAPILIAPAMNGKMWSHPATQQNVATLKSRGCQFIGPDDGMLACGGCDCRTAGGGASGSALSILLALGLLARRRRIV
jgi:MYXO-CTERM domain-containing protein